MFKNRSYTINLERPAAISAITFNPASNPKFASDNINFEFSLITGFNADDDAREGISRLFSTKQEKENVN